MTTSSTFVLTPAYDQLVTEQGYDPEIGSHTVFAAFALPDEAPEAPQAPEKAPQGPPAGR